MRDGATVERDGNDLVVRIPMKLKRRSGRKQIIVPDGLSDTEPTAPPQDAIVDALARAHHWQDLIDEGRYGSITDLAEALGIDRSYVGRILRLTLLAPDIIEAILRGDEPSGLSLARLTKEIPMLWVEQRALFITKESSQCKDRGQAKLAAPPSSMANIIEDRCPALSVMPNANDLSA